MTTSSSTGAPELVEAKQGMASAVEQMMHDAMEVRSPLGVYATIISGALLAAVGTGQLAAPFLRGGAQTSDSNWPSHPPTAGMLGGLL